MGRTAEEMEDVTLLGNKNVKYSMDYAPEMLQTFINKHQDNDYFVKFNCPEFTSLCPITGQPDFATVYISYVPDTGHDLTFCSMQLLPILFPVFRNYNMDRSRYRLSE